MAFLKPIICLLIIATVSAFSTHKPAFTTSTTSLFAGKGEQEGGAAIAKPKVNIGQKTAMVTETKARVVLKKKAKPSGPESRREEKFEDAPMYKVMLLGDKEYDQEHVIKRLCETLEDMDENNAATVFTQAQQGGKAMCGKYPMEHAELYKEQMLRSDPMIFCDIEEENKKGNK
eukprot:CAMPEP_0197822958 /NCGR_PEP_ID=MMETSP1437-20131217/278_1 /TAXON_ID=49252 ORGANISM="Eucampia antarctica, Strain CCMP1452" /NCGR_SAMPLE_ID=MMETSP1437 /ASSEMBLY_ACC=CAM_ASM_001096 /LENGTH=173 /DNA_ID=CAMNT_0043421871 /DNA_START=41 /DNA_END=562 /DNA_ORIENTATION=+